MSAGNTDPVAEIERLLPFVREQRAKAIKDSLKPPDGLLVTEATLPLTINGLDAAEFIKRAYDLGKDCNGPGRFDMHDPVQSALRNVKGWIEMAERDALNARGDG